MNQDRISQPDERDDLVEIEACELDVREDLGVFYLPCCNPLPG